MKHTEEQLKLALVLALPEKLGIDGGAFWKDYSMRNVTSHEWPAIVGMVFRDWLKKQNKNPVEFSYFSPASEWQEVAEYLADIGAIKVEN